MAYDSNFDNIQTGRGQNYSAEFVTNSAIEEQIGLALAKDSRVARFATEITTRSKVKQYGELEQAGKDKVNDEANTFGGARAFKEGWGTLGGAVFAVMNEIEKDKATKSKYSQSNAADHPYFPKDQKKPEFDKPMNELQFGELPLTAQNDLTAKAAAPTLPPGSVPVPSALPMPSFDYNKLNKDAKLAMLKEYRFQSPEAANTANTLKTDLTTPEVRRTPSIFNLYQGGILTPAGVGTRGNIQATLTALNANPNDEAARVAAIQAIRKEITATDDPDEKAQLGALLDIVVDKHSSGQNTNLVSLDKNPDGTDKDNDKNHWIKDTIKAGKPIISGPSGHTLRYLNFWSERRQEDPQAAAGPSLQAARLVMMANLMPPKHHSYDEIMTSSIGITDTTDTLAYAHKSSYEDLDNQQGDAQAPAQQAYNNSGANAVETNAEVETEIANDVAARQLQQADIAAITQHLGTATQADINAIKATLNI